MINAYATLQIAFDYKEYKDTYYDCHLRDEIVSYKRNKLFFSFTTNHHILHKRPLFWCTMKLGAEDQKTIFQQNIQCVRSSPV